VPNQFERHAKSDDGWNEPGSRHDELLRAINDDPAAKPPPGKKDPARCKGNHGDSHEPVVQFRYGNTPQECNGRYQCRYTVKWNLKEHKLVPGWNCNHQLACDKCGKIFSIILGRDRCPVYPGDTEQLADIERQIEERNELRRTSPTWNKRKPVITGPQGYRRKRDEK